MTHWLGSGLILSGGFLVWWSTMAERRRRAGVLADLIAALRRMGEEVRMARPPMPWLLERCAGDCGEAAAAFFRCGAESLRQGEERGWAAAVGALPLASGERAILTELVCDLRGDEEKVCKAISLACKRLETARERRELQRRGEDKQLAAMCFSASALLVILLI